VSFAYTRERPVFSELSLSIEAGEKIGLMVAPARVSQRWSIYCCALPTCSREASVIDGQDIRDSTQESLRANIGMVTQDTSLLHRTVRENILYGRENASEAELVAAIQRARASDFIAALEDQRRGRGLDARVGERGVKLSGGQRQRIAIARVILKDAPILVLDEATSALDSEVEVAIQDSLYELMEGKTVLAIAHRLSTIAALDRLVVVEQGRIVEQGSHSELLARGGMYKRLWDYQSGGFLAAD
jgi:ATP-binding cassette subfamily B multidrug efflux pump